MKNQKGSSRLDAALKMLLIAFISLLAFSSGVYFGKQMSDTDYELKALESDFKDSASEKHASHDGKKSEERPHDALTDEDIAEAGEKLMNEARAEKHADSHDGKRSVASAHDDGHGATAHGDHAAKHEAAKAGAHGSAKTEAHGAKNAHSANAAHGTAKVDTHGVKADAHGAKADRKAASDSSDHADHHGAKGHGEVRKAAHRIAMNEPPSEDAKPVPESRIPKSLPSSIGNPKDGEFTVQVASYPEATEAKSHAADLVKKGFPAYPVEATVKGKTWYRVSVGSFRTSKEAGVYRVQLLKTSDLRSAIVQKIER